MIKYIFPLILIVSSTNLFGQSLDDEINIENEIDSELSIERNSDIEQDIADSLENNEFSDENIKEDIANSIEDDEFSNGTIDQDIAGSLEADETTKPQDNLTFKAKITPFEKKRRLIYHPFASKGLYKITKDLEYLYKTEESEQKNSASLRFGTLEPSNLKTEDQIYFLSDLYDSTSAPMLLFDWEWQLKFLGRLSFKVGTGFYFNKGNGRFNTSDAPNSSPLEDFSLFMLPNSASLVYKFQFWNNQWIIPYADAGVDAFTLLEFIEGNSVPKLGGSFGGHFSVGLAFNISFLDRWSILELDRDHGINSIYLLGEYRSYFHITGPYDFSSDFISGGFAVDF